MPIYDPRIGEIWLNPIENFVIIEYIDFDGVFYYNSEGYWGQRSFIDFTNLFSFCEGDLAVAQIFKMQKIMRKLEKIV